MLFTRNDSYFACGSNQNVTFHRFMMILHSVLTIIYCLQTILQLFLQAMIMTTFNSVPGPLLKQLSNDSLQLQQHCNSSWNILGTRKVLYMVYIAYKCKPMHHIHFFVFKDTIVACNIELAPHEECPSLFHKQGKKAKSCRTCEVLSLICHCIVQKLLHFRGYAA